jgi:putative flippase GtrA
LDVRVPASLIGYVIVNSATFAVDLTVLTGLHGGLGWPLPLSITTSYLLAFGLSFLLNRRLNFHSHAPLGPEGLRYVGVLAINYLLWILGVGDGLTHAGLDYRIARTVAAGCEAIYMYCAMRWFVFRPVGSS